MEEGNHDQSTLCELSIKNKETKRRGGEEGHEEEEEEEKELFSVLVLLIRRCFALTTFLALKKKSTYKFSR